MPKVKVMVAICSSLSSCDDVESKPDHWGSRDLAATNFRYDGGQC